MTVGWVFNLDAEDELLRSAGPHTPSKQLRERTQALLPKLAALLREGDQVVWPGVPEGAGASREGGPPDGGSPGVASAVGLESAAPRATTARGALLSTAGDPRLGDGARWGRAWCPTPWACAQLRRAGLQVPPAPPPGVLRRVNHRRFAQELGQALPGARFVHTLAELLEALADAALLARVSTERNWLLKRPLGYAGRGRRKIASAALNATDRTWVEAALRGGEGLQLEPLVERTLDVGLHGYLSPTGALTLGAPTVQDIDASGMWHATRRAPPDALTEDERLTLEREAHATARALTTAGYFGPFGLDGFRWRAPDGALHFQPRCELNARYAMGWAIGMGDFRPPLGE